MSKCGAPIVLTVAGSDSSGGAGLQADLKTFSALGTYGASVITALTAQNTLGVTAIHYPPAAFVGAQLRAVFDDLDVGAIKIGMAGGRDTICEIAGILKGYADILIVLDPVMVSTTGAVLLEADAEESLRRELVPLANIITPNGAEAARLLGQERTAVSLEERETQARALLDLGPKAVLVTGGDNGGNADQATDIYVDSSHVERLTVSRVDTKNTHGTGCTLSSAIAAYLAQGYDKIDAVRAAKHYVTSALLRSKALKVGEGAGPVHHFHELWDDQNDKL